jgi:hypothetical protein
MSENGNVDHMNPKLCFKNIQIIQLLYTSNSAKCVCSINPVTCFNTQQAINRLCLRKQKYICTQPDASLLRTQTSICTGSGRNTRLFGNTAGEWNRWREKFVLEHPSSETQSILVAMERWSVEHRVFALKTIFKNNNSVVVTQFIFCRHFHIHRNDCP